MAVVPLLRTEDHATHERLLKATADADWVRIAGGGSLLASALLLLTGKRKAGLLTAIAGTALVLLDQQEAVRDGWHALPGYMDNVHKFLTKVDSTVTEVVAQQDRLHKILNK